MTPLNFQQLIPGEWYWNQKGGQWTCWYFDDAQGGGRAWEQTIYSDDGEYWEDAIFFGPIPKPDSPQ